MNSFKAVKITERVYWVGATDWGIRDFHGYSTSRGTTYNAYLVMADEPVLIDTVKAPFFGEMMARISSVVEPEKVRYIISNHAEMDHSGSLPMAIEKLKPEKVFASRAGVQALEAHFHLGDVWTEAKSGETLELCGCRFTFLDTKMLHWPDSMVSFLHDDGVLFSQDGFGMHLATTNLWSSDNDRSVLRTEAAKYYANILLPYSALVSALIDKLPGLGLDIRIIAPDHGPLWKGAEEIAWITGLWGTWAKQEMKPKAVISFDTMWGSTGAMASSIADGLTEAGIRSCVMPLHSSHRSDIATELLEAGAFIVGSPTINQQMFPTVADMLCYVRGLKPRNLLAQAFGSFGWGGEAVAQVKEELEKMKLSLTGEPLKIRYVPDQEALERCREMGLMIGKEMTGVTGQGGQKEANTGMEAEK